MEFKRNYQMDVTIDPSELDREWRDHPALMCYYGEAKAKAQYKLDLAKEKLDLLTAEADREIREGFDSKKPTEAAIANMIMTRSEIVEARRAVLEARHEFALLSAAVEAFQHRKSALENLVRLFGMQYYAEPTEDILTRGAIDSMTEAAVVKTIRSSLQNAGRNTKSRVDRVDSCRTNKGDI